MKKEGVDTQGQYESTLTEYQKESLMALHLSEEFPLCDTHGKPYPVNVRHDVLRELYRRGYITMGMQVTETGKDICDHIHYAGRYKGRGVGQNFEERITREDRAQNGVVVCPRCQGEVSLGLLRRTQNGVCPFGCGLHNILGGLEDVCTNI